MFFLCVAMVIVGSMTMASAAPPARNSVPPVQQSECEIQANKFVALHPRTDPFKLMDHGFFPFGPALPPQPPWTYRDPTSGDTFYVESDGRHLAAVDKNGKLLWVRNPFVDSGMCPYRSAHPYIGWMGPVWGYPHADNAPFDSIRDAKTNEAVAKELDLEIERGRKARQPKSGARFIGLWFNSSQQGYVDISNGDFYEMGQN
jgi:hypothetical protein